MVEMQVTSTNGASGDPQYNIAVFEDLGFWDFNCKEREITSQSYSIAMINFDSLY